MKYTISNQQIIILCLLLVFAFFIYQIYILNVNEYMSSNDKLKQRKKLHSETKAIENKNMPEIHSSIEDMNKQLGEKELNNEKVKYVDKYGKVQNAVISKTLGNPTYYRPGTYRYGSASYIPTYEDSIFLSKSFNNYSLYTSDKKDENLNNKKDEKKDFKEKMKKKNKNKIILY